MSGRLLAVAVTLLLAAGGCATDPVETERSPMLGARTDGAVPAAPPEQEARHAARRFLAYYPELAKGYAPKRELFDLGGRERFVHDGGEIGK